MQVDKICLTGILGLTFLGCGQSSSSTVVTNPPQGVDTSTATSTTATTGKRTVLTPLGLNVRSAGSSTANRLGSAAQGAVLTVLDHNADNGGWYKIQGASIVGWISSDPSLTSPNQFNQYQSTTLGFSSLYRQDWSFAEATTNVVFKPQSGTQNITVTPANGIAALGPAGITGFNSTSANQVVVCGVTTNLQKFSAAALTSPGNGAQYLDELRISIDSTHALGINFQYTQSSQEADFADFYNSLSFNAPQCQKPTTTPGTSPGLQPT